MHTTPNKFVLSNKRRGGLLGSFFERNTMATYCNCFGQDDFPADLFFGSWLPSEMEDDSCWCWFRTGTMELKLQSTSQVIWLSWSSSLTAATADVFAVSGWGKSLSLDFVSYSPSDVGILIQIERPVQSLFRRSSTSGWLSFDDRDGSFFGVVPSFGGSRNIFDYLNQQFLDMTSVPMFTHSYLSTENPLLKRSSVNRI